jgi:hypothetical protein
MYYFTNIWPTYMLKLVTNVNALEHIGNKNEMLMNYIYYFTVIYYKVA